MHNCKDCQHPSCQRIGCDIPGGCPSHTSLLIDTADYYNNKLYIRDADESKSHLCNSLNAESCGCFRMAAACGKDGLYPVSNKQLETLGYYLVRAQAVITYLREEVNQLKEEKTK